MVLNTFHLCIRMDAKYKGAILNCIVKTFNITFPRKTVNLELPLMSMWDINIKVPQRGEGTEPDGRSFWIGSEYM